MNRTAVNLGAGGFVSYYEDGGAAVILDPYLENNQDFSEEPDYAEKGVASFLKEQLFSDPPEGTMKLLPDEIRNSGRTGAESRDIYYPEGQTFFETLADDYNYPTEECLRVSTELILWAVQLAINVRGTICQRLKNWKT
jgi:hypothetical protein